LTPVFADQFAIVTGGGGGIGRAVCQALACRGAIVWAIGRSGNTLAETVAACAGRGRGVVADLTNDPQVDHLAEEARREFGRVDLLVHAAGIISHGAVADQSVEALDAQYRSNVRVPYRVSQILLPLLQKRPGQVVFVNSSIVHGGPRANVSQFAATQHAVRAFADTLRQEVNPVGVRVLCVYPGRTATSRQQRLYEKEGKTYRPELLLQPEDIATMIVAALALPETAEVTDINIRPMLKSY
jgi:NADP-dependent 3-hydroxy acid dehydrogenase YdfG